MHCFAIEATDPQLKRHVGVIGLLFASVGSIIGSGWLFGALNASQAAGPAAIICVPPRPLQRLL